MSLRENRRSSAPGIMPTGGTVSGAIVVSIAAIGATLTAGAKGVETTNPTAAANGAQQYSPAIQLAGRGWDTGASASRLCEAALQMRPTQGNPVSAALSILTQVNGGGWVEWGRFGDAASGSGLRVRQGGANNRGIVVVANGGGGEWALIEDDAGVVGVITGTYAGLRAAQSRALRMYTALAAGSTDDDFKIHNQGATRTAGNLFAAADATATRFAVGYDGRIKLPAAGVAPQATGEIGSDADGRARMWVNGGSVAAMTHDFAGSVQTTDATVTTAGSYTPPDNKVTEVRVMIVGRRSDGTQGAGYSIRATVRRQSGTTTLIGAVTAETAHEDNAAWDGTLDVSSPTIRARVTGAAGVTVDWVCKGFAVST